MFGGSSAVKVDLRNNLLRDYNHEIGPNANNAITRGLVGCPRRTHAHSNALHTFTFT